jgi:hypothetical protein
MLQNRYRQGQEKEAHLGADEVRGFPKAPGMDEAQGQGGENEDDPQDSRGEPDGKEMGEKLSGIANADDKAELYDDFHNTAA